MIVLKTETVDVKHGSMEVKRNRNPAAERRKTRDARGRMMMTFLLLTEQLTSRCSPAHGRRAEEQVGGGGSPPDLDSSDTKEKV